MGRQRFRIGDRVVLSEEAKENENYARYHDKVLTISHVAWMYMPAKEFFAKGQPNGYHPGFDAGGGSSLYDFEGDIPFSLYDWELESANSRKRTR